MSRVSRRPAILPKLTTGPHRTRCGRTTPQITFAPTTVGTTTDQISITDMRTAVSAYYGDR
jgi:hypothetical protein